MSKLDIHVGETFAETKRRVLDAVARAERGEAVGETHVTFDNWEALASVMTPRRYELLRHLHRSPETSVAALARRIGRDYKHVHEDVQVLAAAGLLERSQAGLAASYDEIQTRITL